MFTAFFYNSYIDKKFLSNPANIASMHSDVINVAKI